MFHYDVGLVALRGGGGRTIVKQSLEGLKIENLWGIFTRRGDLCIGAEDRGPRLLQVLNEHIYLNEGA